MDERLRFQSFASGSSGNCYYLGNASHAILIDAGIGVRTIRRYIRNMGYDFPHIWAIFVTHDHADHIRAVGSLGERYHIPVYTTPMVHEGIQRSYCVTDKLYTSRKYIEKHQTVQIGEFHVTAFPVSHDATDSVGYTVEYRGKRFTFATDLGYVSDDVANYVKHTDYLVLEANYDEQMLANGVYPPHLKRRVASTRGHLSNDQAGRFLADYYHEQLQYIFLCHLSKENNYPEMACNTIQTYLEKNNILVGEDVHLVPLERMSPSRLYLF